MKFFLLIEFLFEFYLITRVLHTFFSTNFKFVMYLQVITLSFCIKLSSLWIWIWFILNSVKTKTQACVVSDTIFWGTKILFWSHILYSWLHFSPLKIFQPQTWDHWVNFNMFTGDTRFLNCLRLSLSGCLLQY